ncbi:MAG: ATP-binding protein [Candidatus Nealsonbacteria bacterium DGGOD1a]|nr:MAG: ATP-binding protein [Candidatus Nealsonbacteria bacterium DGGOD1a]
MEKYKKRILFNSLVKYFDSKEALVVTGMRQVGKTTLMRQIFNWAGNQPKLWFDFENPLDVKIFEDIDYSNIYRNLEKMAKKADNARLVIFIDEIQIYPEMTKIIKYLIDHYRVKFIVTGSSNYYLKNLFPESLSGRKFLFELPTLSFQEYLYFKDKIEEKEAMIDGILQSLKNNTIFNYKKFETDYNDFVHYGGFPAVVLESDIDAKKQILRNIFSSFFEKDLKILSDYKDIQELRDLLLLLVPRIGSLIDVTRLAAELGINRPKVYHYLEFLQGTFVVNLLPRYTKSIDKAVAGGRKVYFSDTGLLQVMGNVNDAQLFENAVINQLVRYGKVSFYNKRNTAEIDAILDKKIAFEIKLTGTLQDVSKLQKLATDIQLPSQYVISKKFIESAGFISPVVL